LPDETRAKEDGKCEMAGIELLRRRVFFKLHATRSSQGIFGKERRAFCAAPDAAGSLLAAYGGDRAQQGMSGLDVQLQRAVEEMPKATDLALISWRHKRTSIRQ
jgi:hypothetical protein